MVWEDLHWADASTLEWLGLLIDQAPTSPLLTLLTYRSNSVRHGRAAPTSPSSPSAASRAPRGEAMVTRVASGKALPRCCNQIVARTDGVPLFVEELTKMVLESGLLQERQGHYDLTGPLPLWPFPPPSTTR